MSGAMLIQGASRGIGLAFVDALLERHETSPVIATCRRPEKARALSERAALHSERLRVLALDVEDEPTIAECGAKLAADGVEIDLLINCAGILHDDTMQPEKRLDDLDPAALARAFAINATGPLLVAKHLHRLLRHGRRAVFASLSARIGSIADNRKGGWYAYRASKAAQNMGTRTLSLELGRSAPHVICVALHPGTVATDLSAPFCSRVPEDRLFTPERAASQLLDVIAALEPDQTGSFLAWDGSPIPW
jgi:NAD(P)-dependent dehydrogenase (short-subunit alcohol dehydrogenase family)